jgi:hypothetical protein
MVGECRPGNWCGYDWSNVEGRDGFANVRKTMGCEHSILKAHVGQGQQLQQIESVITQQQMWRITSCSGVEVCIGIAQDTMYQILERDLNWPEGIPQHEENWAWPLYFESHSFLNDRIDTKNCAFVQIFIVMVAGDLHLFKCFTWLQSTDTIPSTWRRSLYSGLILIPAVA